MKIRTAFPLLYVLSFLMVAAASSSAQLIPLYPYSVAISFDSTSVTQDYNQLKITPDTIRGFIQDESMFGSYNMTVNLTTAKQWIITTMIGGSVVQDGDVINIAQSQKLSVEIIFIPYAEVPDTESYCLTLSLDPTYIINQHCIKLTLTNAKSEVNTDLPGSNVSLAPNPAGSYIFLRGLTGDQSGYRYEIFSISGAEVHQGLLSADARINVQDLSSGAYRLLLFDSKGMLSNTALTVLH